LITAFGRIAREGVPNTKRTATPTQNGVGQAGSLLLLLLLLLLHDLYSTNFEDQVGGTGIARWRTSLTGEGDKVRF